MESYNCIIVFNLGAPKETSAAFRMGRSMEKAIDFCIRTGGTAGERRHDPDSNGVAFMAPCAIRCDRLADSVGRTAVFLIIIFHTALILGIFASVSAFLYGGSTAIMPDVMGLRSVRARSSLIERTIRRHIQAP